MNENTQIEIRADNYFAVFPHWVLDLKLSSSAIHLYIALLSFANWETKRGRPSRQTLANLMNCSIRTVDRAKDELVANRLLTYTQRRGNSNYYTVITANPSSAKNDTSDKNDIGSSDKNDIQTIINNNNKDAEANASARNASPAQKLTLAYIENLPDWAIKPSFPQIAGQMAGYLKSNSFDELLPVVIECASLGKALSIYDLQRIQEKRERPKDPPTPTPPRFIPENRVDAVPMPANFRELLQSARKNAIEGD